MHWMLLPYKKLYRLIEGRSQRQEFWMFFLLNVLIGLALLATVFAVGFSMASLGGGLGATDSADIGSMNAAGMGPAGIGALMAGAGVSVILLVIVFYVWFFLTSVAGLAVAIRRLHDLGFTGWLLLVYYAVLIVSAFISPWLYLLVAIGFLVVMALPGNRGPNKYGPDPLEGDGLAAFA